MSKDLWPFPGDTKVERILRVFRSYRMALATADPALCELLDEQAIQLGQTWVRPTESIVTDLDELLTAEQVGELFNVEPRTVRMWGYRGHIERHGDAGAPRYRMRDVVDYCAKTRRERAA